jgi:hypothetical protein
VTSLAAAAAQQDALDVATIAAAVSAAAALFALAVSAWSAVSASRASKQRETPRIDVRFVRARPGSNEHEETNPWADPALRITNNGPHNYDNVLVEIVQAADEIVSAQSSPFLSMMPLEGWDGTSTDFSKQQNIGSLDVGQFSKLAVVTNPAAHGATVTLRFKCSRERLGGLYSQRWVTGVQVDVPPAPPTAFVG